MHELSGARPGRVSKQKSHRPVSFIGEAERVYAATSCLLATGGKQPNAFAECFALGFVYSFTIGRFKVPGKSCSTWFSTCRSHCRYTIRCYYVYKFNTECALINEIIRVVFPMQWSKCNAHSVNNIGDVCKYMSTSWCYFPRHEQWPWIACEIVYNIDRSDQSLIISTDALPFVEIVERDPTAPCNFEITSRSACYDDIPRIFHLHQGRIKPSCSGVLAKNSCPDPGSSAMTYAKDSLARTRDADAASVQNSVARAAHALQGIRYPSHVEIRGSRGTLRRQNDEKRRHLAGNLESRITRAPLVAAAVWSAASFARRIYYVWIY